MGIDVITLALSKKFTEETVEGAGAIKGAPCQVKSITDIEGGKRVTFLWKDNSNVDHESTMDVMNGSKGDTGKGIKHSYVNEENHFIIVYDDDTEEDCGEITVVCVDTLNELADVDLDEPADGEVLKFNAETGKWENGTGGGGGDASLESAVTSNLAVGAISSNTTLPKGTSFTEFVQKLLITEVAPTISFSISKSGNVAQGDSYTETLTVNCTAMGSAKKIKTIAWYEGSTLKQTDIIDSTTTGSWAYTMPTATTANTTFKAIVTYTKSDNTDTSVTKTASISFYYPKYYGSVGSLTPDEATVKALTSALATAKGGTYTFTTSASRIAYAYPKSLGALTSIKDGNGFSLFDSFTRTEQSYTQNGTSVAYYLYVLTESASVSGYSVTFA